ncbi:Noc2-domain-containing protein, partial [Lichtheimia hyalospora FSU 10163]
MGVKQKKSTIKFQRTKLKQTIERRRQHNKLKQQINRRKERRAARAKDNGTKADAKKDQNASDKTENFDQHANAADFFCNFMIGSEEVLDLEEDREIELNALDQFQAVEPEEGQEEDDMQLDQEQDAEEEESEQEDDDDDDDDEGFDSEDDMEQDDDDDMEEDEDEDSNATIVTKEMLDEWIKGAQAKSPDALKHLLMAFRSITRSDDGTDTQMSYRVTNHKLYTKVVKVAVKSTYPILSQHIIITKKARHPAKTKHWRRLEKVVHLFLNSCVRFLRDLDQDDLVQYILTHIAPATMFFGCFPKTAREYLRVLLDRWSDSALSSETRAACYQAIKLFATAAIDTEKNNYLPHALKGVYLIFAKHSTRVTESNHARLQQMLQEGTDLYAVDPKVGAQHADVYIRQLSSHLKAARKSQTQESIRSVYAWQFISCLDFWAGAIGLTCSPEMGTASLSVLQPFVDIALNTMRLNPVPQFLPLRVHVIRSLISLIDSTGYYIPLAPFIFNLFYVDPSEKIANVDLPAFDWDLNLKTPQEYMHTKVYESAKFNAFYDNMIDFYACFGMSIAFPELAIPVLSKLKEDQKVLKGTRFAKPVRTLIEKFDTHKNYIEQKRAPIEYSATKLDEAEAFLRNTEFEKT